MPEEFAEKLTAKTTEILAEITVFYELSQQLNEASEHPDKAFKAMFLLLKTGKQARKLADRLFEYSELMEELEADV